MTNQIDEYKNELKNWINEGIGWMERGNELLSKLQKGNSKLATCSICEINYIPKREGSIYCSNACKMKAKRNKTKDLDTQKTDNNQEFDIENKEVKEAKRNIPLWRIAKSLGVHEMTVIRWFREEMDEEKKQRVLYAIDEVKTEMVKELS